MNKNIVIILIVCFISACTPRFVSHNQEIVVYDYDTEPKNAGYPTYHPYSNNKYDVFVEGEDKSIKKKYWNEDDYYIKVKKGPSDLNLVFKKEGYKDYHLTLKSVEVNEDYYMGPYVTSHGVMGVLAGVAGETFSTSLNPFERVVYFVGGLVLIPVGIVVDAVSTIFVPLAYMYNPKYKYEESYISGVVFVREQ